MGRAAPKRFQRRLNGAVAATARAILGEARRALADPELNEPELVHELRKAFKRWRALLRLLALPLGEQADQMRAEAKELMRKLAPARDAQSAMDAVRDLRKAETVPPAALTALRDRLAAIRDAADRKVVTPALRRSLSRYLDYCALSLERWPLDNIVFDTLADALTSAYRRARRSLPQDWDTASAEELHELRRRVVEHQNQMSVFDMLRPHLAENAATQTQRLRSQLGACQDLAVLEHIAAARPSLAPWRPRLPTAIAVRRATHLKNAKRAAKRVFAQKPKSFRRNLLGLTEPPPNGGTGRHG